MRDSKEEVCRTPFAWRGRLSQSAKPQGRVGKCNKAFIELKTEKSQKLTIKLELLLREIIM